MRRIASIPRGNADVLLDEKAGAPGLVGAEVGPDATEQRQRLPAGDCVGEGGRVMVLRTNLARDPSRAYHRPHIKKQGQLRTADAHHGPTILAPMRPRERNGALTVYDPGKIRRLGVG